MKREDEVTLSYYCEVEKISENISLVRHAERQQFFVRKIRPASLDAVYSRLMELNVPGTPKIHHLIKDDDKVIIIEEFINGITLSEYLEDNGTLSSHISSDIVSQLCLILEELHKANPPIIHRDIKPSNIILDSNFNVTLIDFDASKAFDRSKNRDTVLMGTADFAAPEQFGFGQSDPRTDIYGLGILLNVMLTGKIPSDSTYEGKLAPVIKKCTSINPAERYKSVALLYRRLNPPKRTFVPPGFRSGSPRNAAIAIIGYLFMFFACWWMEVKPPEPLWWEISNKLAALLLMLSTIVLAFDYAGISSRLPLAGSPRKLFSWLGRLLWFFIFAVIILSVLTAISPAG